MRIVLDHNYHAMVDDKLLGYVGETQSRTMTFVGLAVDGADSYSIVFDYGDNEPYEADITGGKYTVGGSVLKRFGTVKCQVLAKAFEDGIYTIVKKSDVFVLNIGKSIGDPAPVPPYEQAVSALDEIRKIMAGSGSMPSGTAYAYADGVGALDVVSGKAGQVYAETSGAVAVVSGDISEVSDDDK